MSLGDLLSPMELPTVGSMNLCSKQSFIAIFWSPGKRPDVSSLIK
jgi:hypothetical protein